MVDNIPGTFFFLPLSSLKHELVVVIVHLTFTHAYTHTKFFFFLKSFLPNKEISGVHVNNTLLSLFFCPGLKPGDDEHQQSAVWNRKGMEGRGMCTNAGQEATLTTIRPPLPTDSFNLFRRQLITS